MRRPASG